MAAAAGKACIIGLDGATFDVLDEWLASGDMPHLAELIARGCRGELQSTVPSVTGPAWTSMTTGVNPGTHGIFDFFKWDSTGVAGRLAQSSDVPVPRLWDLAADAGRTVGVFNVPVTFPAYAVNGFMVTGMLTPRPGQAMAYPESLFEQLRRQGLVPPNRVSPPAEPLKAAEALIKAQEANLRTVEYLLGEYRPDLFMGVFTETDRLQHRLWQYCDRSLADEDPALAETVRRFYRGVDRIIGRLIDFFGDDATYYVTSDHGFGPRLMECRLNNYLADRGLLKLKRWRFRAHNAKQQFESAVKAVLAPLGLLAPVMAALGKTTRRRKKTVVARIDQFTQIARFVDWSRTRAFVKSRSDGGVHVNLRGRYPHGIVEPGRQREEVVDEVIAALEQMEDPISGGRLDAHLGRREQVMTGTYVSEAPDLYVAFRKGTIAVEKIVGGPLFAPGPKSGTHRREGVLVAAGPGIKAGGKVDASIMDVTPTVLHAMGLPVPSHIEGRVLTDLFEQAWMADRPISRQTEPADVARQRPEPVQYSQADEQAVTERLKQLGYL